MLITFSVSTGDSLLIKAGQTVDFTSLLAKKTFSKQTKINLAQQLQIDPKNIFMHLTKVVGDEITKGEVIAKKKTMLSEKQYVSEHQGTIKEIDHEDGSILINTKTATEEKTHSFFKGEVEAIKKNEITLKVKKAKGFALKEASGDFGGEVFFIQTEAPGMVSNDDVERKVIFIDSIKSYSQVKFEVMGIAGIVTLQQLTEDTATPHARAKSQADWDEMKLVELPFCLISKKSEMIYFYQ